MSVDPRTAGPRPPFPERQQEEPELEGRAARIPVSMPPEVSAHFSEDSPFGRPAQPAELAPARVLLACDESRCVTGGEPL